MAEIKVTGKQATVGGISLATVMALAMIHGYLPHAQAEENEDRLTQIEQYIAVQQESNRLQAEYNRQIQNMQQAPPGYYRTPGYYPDLEYQPPPPPREREQVWPAPSREYGP